MNNTHNKNSPEFLSAISITAWIIITNIIVWIILFILLNINEDYINYFALNPDLIMQGKYIWTIILHMFSHLSPLHLFVNMFALFSFGKLCERIIGRKRFGWFYITAGLVAGILSVLLSYFFGYGFGERILGSPAVYMIGASGAIFGIAGLFVVLLPRLKFSIIFLPFWSFPAYIIVPALLVILWALSIGFNLPVGNVAHFGGLLSGLIYGFYLRNKYQKKVYMLQRMFR
ncbi:rhomboid family intramembrane serine protease [Candidatus Pacearchaeota archaeon]|nr:rhomboid family intramembrane serine protease [Candidatus Pacearchaeota archaeon]